MKPPCFQTNKIELRQILLATSTVKLQFLIIIFQRLRSTIFGEEEISSQKNSKRQESGVYHTSNV